MSRATRMAMAWLVVGQGSLERILVFDIDSELTGLVSSAIEEFDEAFDQWPQEGDFNKDLKWVDNRIEAFDKALAEADVAESITLMIAIATHTVTELYEVSNNKYKKKLLAPIFVKLTELNNWIETSDYTSCEKADQICSKLNSILNKEAD